MSLLETFLDTARRRGHQPAIIDGEGRATTFSELAEWSARLASAWRDKGIAKGDRVLLAVPLGAGLYAGLAALWRLGAVAVFPEPAMGLKGLRHAAATMQPKAYLSAGWLKVFRYVVPELWRVPVALDPGDHGRDGGIIEPLAADHPALISFTSGSTGAPKAISRSHGFLMAQHAAVSPMLATSRDDERDLVAFPVFVLVDLALGVTSVLPCWKVTRHDQADMAELAAFAARQRVTRMLVPPSICERMAETAVPPGIGDIFTGGGPVFPDVLLRLREKSPETRITAVYGSTEAEPIAHVEAGEIADDDWRAMREGRGLLAGRPVPQVSLKLIGGEIVVTGGHVNKGYMDPARDAATKLTIGGDIWHRTGDAGRLDEQGRLWLLGRQDGAAGGLDPFCVEAAARFWPGVTRAALIGVDGAPVLAVEGDAAHRAGWESAAAAMGVTRVIVLPRIPLDRRHRSKVDYAALRAALARS